MEYKRVRLGCGARLQPLAGHYGAQIPDGSWSRVPVAGIRNLKLSELAIECEGFEKDGSFISLLLLFLRTTSTVNVPLLMS